MFYVNFYELQDPDPKFCKKPHLHSDPNFFLDSLQPYKIVQNGENDNDYRVKDVTSYKKCIST